MLARVPSVLVVDDEPSILETVGGVLRDEGYDVAVLFLSARDGVDDRVAGLRIGARFDGGRRRNAGRRVRDGVRDRSRTDNGRGGDVHVRRRQRRKWTTADITTVTAPTTTSASTSGHMIDTVHQPALVARCSSSRGSSGACSAAAQRSGVELSIACDDDVPHGLIDPPRLEQSLTNIVVGTAIKFTSPGGEVWLSVGTGVVDAGPGASPEASVDITVADTGVGIAPSEVDQIFDRFYRTGQATTLAIKGTGLGLPSAASWGQAVR